MEALSKMTATISPTERRVDDTAAKRKTADRCPDEIEIQTPIVLMETRPPHYRNVRTSRVVVVIPIWMTANVGREDAGASSK